MRDKYAGPVFWFALVITAVFVGVILLILVLAALGVAVWQNAAIATAASLIGATAWGELLRRFFVASHLPNDAVGRFEEQLKEYVRNRFATVNAVVEIQDYGTLSTFSSQLMRYFLQFLEARLRTRAPDTSFEISVFANAEEPEIICYFDSSGAEVPRTWRDRQANPQFYKEKKYEAVELLQRPTESYELIVIARTDESNYSFRDDEQRERIKSTCLCSFVAPEPLVIVLVANRPELFDASDAVLGHLVPAALMSIAFERAFCTRVKLAA